MKERSRKSCRLRDTAPLLRLRHSLVGISEQTMGAFAFLCPLRNQSSGYFVGKSSRATGRNRSGCVRLILLEGLWRKPLAMPEGELT